MEQNKDQINAAVRGEAVAELPTMRFRKKPVEIEAIQWTGNLECLDAFNIPELHQSLGSKNVGIPTLEGTMIAHVGDWIIKGVKGEFYPCKPEIFELTYVSARAADALDSQPNIAVKLKEWEAYAKSTSLDERNGDLCQMIAELQALPGIDGELRDVQNSMVSHYELLQELSKVMGFTKNGFLRDMPKFLAAKLDSQPTELYGYMFWDPLHKDGEESAFMVQGNDDPATGNPDYQGHVWMSIPLYKRASSQPTDGGVRNGWALVPTKYTPEMRAAWDSARSDEDDSVEFANAWQAILAASPAAVKANEGAHE